MVLYSAVSSPLDRSKRFTLSSPGRPVPSDTVIDFSWGQDYKEKHKTRHKTNVKRTMLNNTKLRHFRAQIVSWAPIHARKTLSASLGIILAMQQLRNDYSLTFPPLSIARYSFIQLSRLRRREVKENAQTYKRYQRGFEPGLSWLRVRHSTAEPPRSTIQRK